MRNLIKPIDPEKVACLEETEYLALFQAVDLWERRTREQDFPPELYAQVFRIMRKCGVIDLLYHEEMKITYTQLKTCRLTIERLRAHKKEQVWNL